MPEPAAPQHAIREDPRAGRREAAGIPGRELPTLLPEPAAVAGG